MLSRCCQTWVIPSS